MILFQGTVTLAPMVPPRHILKLLDQESHLLARAKGMGEEEAG
jgi:hypothetical protein